MEEFLNINWSWKRRRSSKEHLEFHKFSFATHNETDIFYTNLNEIDHIHYENHQQSETDQQSHNVLSPTDPRNNQAIDRVIVDVTHKDVCGMFNKFPTKSRLNHLEQKLCLRALRRIHLPYEQLTQLEKTYRDAYNKSLPKINAENEAFNKFVKSYFLTNLLSRKRHIASAFNSFVENNWRRNIGKILLAPNQFFQLQSALLLHSEAQNEQELVKVDFVKTLWQTGWIPRSKFEIQHPVNSFLQKNQDRMSYLQDQKLKSKASKCSDLENDLIENHDFDILVNLSTLMVMCCYPENTTTTWAVPLEVRATGGEGNVILLRKPLPPVSQNTFSRNMKALKYAFKSTFLHFEHKSAFSLDQNKKFGDIPELSEKPERTSHKNVIKKDFQAYRIEEYLSRVGHILTPNEKAVYFSNTICRMHELKTTAAALKMVVISHQDCCEKLHDELVNINLSFKLEYQVEFGAEQMTKNELMREFLHHYFRPCSKTLRLHIDSQTSKCLSHQYLELEEIEEELQRLHGVDPRSLLQQFHTIMTIVRNFPEGRYLLRHEKKNQEKVMLYQFVNDEETMACSSNINLHDLYSAVQYERSHLESYEWTPIDRLRTTQIHSKANCLPGIFPHSVTNKKKKLIQDFIKVQAKPPPKPTLQQLKRLRKQKKRKGKAKQQKVKPPIAVFDDGFSETLDPRELFNTSGEVLVDGHFLAKSPEKSEPMSWGSLAQPLDINAYISEARTPEPVSSVVNVVGVNNSSLNALMLNYESDSDEFFGFNET